MVLSSFTHVPTLYLQARINIYIYIYGVRRIVSKPQPFIYSYIQYPEVVSVVAPHASFHTIISVDVDTCSARRLYH